MDLNPSYFLLWIVFSIILDITATANPKRFLFDFVYDCQHCFQCSCQLQRCPNWNIFEISGAYAQCAFTLKDFNCFYPFHEDGGWTRWSQWTTCKGSCTSGTRERTRTCTNPAPHNCGTHCEGSAKDVDYDCLPSWCVTSGPPNTANITQAIHVSTPEQTRTTTFTDTSTPQPTTASTSTKQASVFSTVSSSSISTGPKEPPSTTSSSGTISAHTPRELSTVSSSTPMSRDITAETSSTTTSEISKTVTPTPPFDIGICGYYCSLNALITQNRLTDARADVCPGGTHDGDDALPIACCNITQSANWQPGMNVMQNCDNIRMYNPIASFVEDSLLKGTSGIYLGCIDNGSGFQMLHQDCDNATHLVRVTEQQAKYPLPSTFYVVV